MQQPMMQQPMMQQPMKKQRPMGITILAILAFIGGVLALLGGIAAIGLSSLAGGVIGSAAADAGVSGADAVAAATAVGGLGVILGVVLLLTALLDLLFAFGAWGLKKWALVLGIIAQLLALGVVAYNVSQGVPIGDQITSIAIPVLIILYLFTPGVRKAFA